MSEFAVVDLLHAPSAMFFGVFEEDLVFLKGASASFRRVCLREPISYICFSSKKKKPPIVELTYD